MKKALLLVALIIVSIVIVINCNHSGKSAQAVMTIGESNKFSQEEISGAMACVKTKFKDFQGCTLTELWYDEGRSNALASAYLSNGRGSVNGVKAENVIVLLSNFKVGFSGGDGSLNPNSTYREWSWTLIRDGKGSSWRVDDWGY